jgi:substrate import-associated zinc metallohydrolase lipoprotein
MKIKRPNKNSLQLTIRLIQLFPVILLILVPGCYEKEELNVPVKQPPDVIQNEIDEYIEDNFTKEFGMAIRYRFVDRYVSPTQRVTPPKFEIVQPMLNFIEDFWIDPFLAVENGEDFFRNHVPAEIVLLGGVIYNEDGTIILGTADAGAQITFTDVNSLDLSDSEWVLQQLHTVYHEFAHIVHQRYKLPAAFETISPQGYTSAGSWFILSDEEALIRGFVSPYATSSPNEDFAETAAFYLFDEFFTEYFIIQEENCQSPECEQRNEGRRLIQQKLNSVLAHYKKVTGVDLDEVRTVIQAKL